MVQLSAGCISAARTGGAPEAARVPGLSVAVNVVHGGMEELEPREELQVLPVQLVTPSARGGYVLGFSEPRAAASGPK